MHGVSFEQQHKDQPNETYTMFYFRILLFPIFFLLLHFHSFNISYVYNVHIENHTKFIGITLLPNGDFSLFTFIAAVLDLRFSFIFRFYLVLACGNRSPCNDSFHSAGRHSTDDKTAICFAFCMMSTKKSCWKKKHDCGGDSMPWK